MEKKNIYSIDAIDNKGEKVSLSKYKGKVLLIVNTATRCGFTPSYKELQNLYDNYKDKGFEILDFPSNDFNQANEDDEEINKIVTSTYQTTFPRFLKVHVNGDEISEVYKFLISKIGFQGFNMEHPLGPILDKRLKEKDPDYKSKSDVKWNFTKFLIDKEGNVVYRFEPTSPIFEVEEKISALLDK